MPINIENKSNFKIKALKRKFSYDFVKIVSELISSIDERLGKSDFDNQEKSLSLMKL